MRLIDADTLPVHHGIDVGSDYGGLRAIVFKRDIDNALIIDAVPVVRCRDCRYMTEHYDTDGNAPYWTCSQWYSATDYDGYCHYGERKDDGSHPFADDVMMGDYYETD